MSKIDPADIDPASALTLVVGWAVGKKTHLRQVAIGGDVANAFRSAITTTLADLGKREEEEWAPDADLTPETYLVIPEADLGSAPNLASEHDGMTFAGALGGASMLPALPATDLPVGDLSFYALTVGNTPGQRVTFLRRSNPRRGLKRGRIYTYLSDSLQRVEEPIFAFDEYFDLIFVPGQVAVLSQTVFAAMFRDQDVLKAQVPTWAGDLHGSVPIGDAGRQRLIDRTLRDSRLRARLESIVRRGHLSAVPVATMKAAMTDAGLDPNVLIDASGELVLAENDIPQVLYFLNEDLFVGALTSTGFRADKKAAR